MQESKKVLIIDDDVKLTEIYSEVLKGAGFEIVVVNQANTAIESISAVTEASLSG